MEVQRSLNRLLFFVVFCVGSFFAGRFHPRSNNDERFVICNARAEMTPVVTVTGIVECTFNFGYKQIICSWEFQLLHMKQRDAMNTLFQQIKKNIYDFKIIFQF